MNTCKRHLPQRPTAFTLIELLVVIGIIVILAGLLFPSLAAARRKANQIKCLNNLRQVNLAASMYAGDHNGEYPARRRAAQAWPMALLPYYKEPNVLVCPSDRLPPGFAVGEGLTNRVMGRRSYVINGFNDHFRRSLSEQDYLRFDLWQWPHGMKESEIAQPSDTLVFGEKREGSFHVHMDFVQGEAGNDVEEVEQNRHRAGGAASTDGGSNFAFVDGSVRLLKYGQSVRPVNLWATVDEWRNAPSPLQ
jgi:prepilin-type processing-associated H-X9-DG protein